MSRFRIVLLCLFVASLAIRLVLVHYVFPPGYFLKYPGLVQAVDAGDKERALDGSFAYTVFHRSLGWIAGPDLQLRLVVQLALGSLSVVLLAMIGRRLAGDFVGLLVGVGAALSSELLIYDSMFEPESMLLLLTLSWVWLYMRWMVAPGATCLAFLAGLACGASIVTRPIALLAVPFLIAWAPERRRRLAAWVTGVALPVLVLLARNYIVTGSVTISMMNPGTVFYLGHNPWASGAPSAYPLVVKEQEMQFAGQTDYAHVLFRQIARSVIGPGAGVARCNGYWTGLALRYAAEYPRADARLLVHKLQFLFSGYEVHDVEQGAADEEAIAGLPLLRFGWIVPLGLAGILMAVFRRAAAHFRLILILLACSTLTNLVFYVSARQRVQMVPWMILFAAYGVREIGLLLRSKLYSVLLCWLVFVGILAHVMMIPLPLAGAMEALRADSRIAGRAYRSALKSTNPAARRAWAVVAVASAPYAYDKLRPAGVSYDAAFYREVARQARVRASASPGNPNLLLSAGIAEVLAGELDQARATLGQLVESGSPAYLYYFAPSSPHYYLGLCQERVGRAEEALNEYARALQDQPGCPWTLGRRADLLRRLHRVEEARPIEALLDRLVDPATESLALGVPAFEAGDYVESARRFRALSEILPDYFRARVFLAASLERLHDPAARGEIDELSRFRTTLAFPECDFPRVPAR